MTSKRFSEYLALAREGDQNAVSDLWKEFEFNFYSDVPPSETEATTIYCDD